MAQGSSGIAVCYLNSPATAWQSPFWQWHSGWCVQAGKCSESIWIVSDRKCSESLTAGGQSSPARSAFQPVPHISWGWRKETLFGIQYQCTCYTSRKYLHPSNSREKKASLCIPETNQWHYKCCSSVREKHHPELSFPDHCQSFISRVAFNVAFPFSHPPQHNVLWCWQVPSIPAVDGLCQPQLLPACLEPRLTQLEPSWPTKRPLFSPWGWQGVTQFQVTGMLLQVLQLLTQISKGWADSCWSPLWLNQICWLTENLGSQLWNLTR